MPRIRVLDTETQGLEAEHLVCELGWCDVVNGGDGWKIDRHGSSLHRVDEMPPQARAVHHISAEETQGFPAFDPAAMWADCKVDGVDVVAAHVMAFDVLRFGDPPLPLICTFKAARQLWPREAPAHGNNVLRYWLQDRGLISLDPAKCLPPHRAGPDAYVTAHVLLAMLAHTTAAQMVAWTKLPVLQPVITFGKHRGCEWSDRAVGADYLDWIVTKSDMDADTKWNADQERQRRREQRAA